MSNHTAHIKLSHKDDVLIPYFIAQLFNINPGIQKRIKITESLENADVIIATGSDNTARYFDYLFGNKPHIIRKNRTSVAVLTGEESVEELQSLADDAFLYFGLGCRNVSKIFVPEKYDLQLLINSFKDYTWIKEHKKFSNNYIIQKAINTINQDSYHDGEFYLMKKSPALLSPVSVLYYEPYRNINELNATLDNHYNLIQCIVSHHTHIEDKIEFGRAQFPEITDYADQIDTMKFLENIR